MADQRYRTISYDTLDQQFTDKSCTIESIDLPYIQRSRVVPVHLTGEKAPQYFHTTERKEIVKFTVTYIPLDSDEGKGLLPQVKKTIDDVLTSAYKPAVATINLIRNGETEDTVTINDCIVTGGEITLDKGDYIRLKFNLQGILSADF